MADRFRSYEELPESYKPDNRIKVIPQQLREYIDKPPYKDYDIKGNFIAYWWNYGDTLSLPFTINKEHYVEEDAILYTNVSGASYVDPLIVPGEHPTTDTQGYVGQRAYNVMTGQSWTYTGILNGDFVWVEDTVKKFPVKSSRTVLFIDNEWDVSDFNLKFEILDFRRQVLYTTETNGANNIQFPIDKELSQKLLKDTYICHFTLYDDDEVYLETEYNVIVK